MEDQCMVDELTSKLEYQRIINICQTVEKQKEITQRKQVGRYTYLYVLNRYMYLFSIFRNKRLPNWNLKVELTYEHKITLYERRLCEPIGLAANLISLYGGTEAYGSSHRL